MRSIGKFLKRTLAAFCIAAGIPVAFGLALRAAEDWAMRMVYGAFGWLGIVLTGMAGTPVHETGHYLACLLFRLPVTEVSLFRPVSGREDGVLGYVRFVCDGADRWQRLGSFFAGIAPLFFGAFAILLLVWLLTPEVFTSAAASVGTALRKSRNPLRLMGAVAGGYLKGFGALRRFGAVRGMVCLYLICSISMHMSLSASDLQGLPEGLLLILALCALFSLVTLLFRVDVKKRLARAAAVFSVFFGMGLLLCLLFGLLARLAMLRF